MELIALIDRFVRFQNEAADLFISVAGEMQAVDPRTVAICADQFNFMAARGDAIVELLKLNALWDAQMLVRPLVESCVKVAFLCFSPVNDRPQLCEEYETVLAAVNALKLHDKAQKIMEAAGETHPTLEGLLLDESELSRLRETIPKGERRKVEAKWGFTRMVLALDKQAKTDFGGAPFSAFLHLYGLASHLIHADEMGLGTIRARASLHGGKAAEIELSHHVALLSAVAGGAMISAVAIARAGNLRLDEAHQLVRRFNRLHDFDAEA